jgi:hypothetical protein
VLLLFLISTLQKTVVVAVLAKQLLQLVLLTEADPSMAVVVADQVVATRLRLLFDNLVLVVNPTSIHLAVAVLLARLVLPLRLARLVLTAHPLVVVPEEAVADLPSKLLLMVLLAVLAVKVAVAVAEVVSA